MTCWCDIWQDPNKQDFIKRNLMFPISFLNNRNKCEDSFYRYIKRKSSIYRSSRKRNTRFMFMIHRRVVIYVALVLFIMVLYETASRAV